MSWLYECLVCGTKTQEDDANKGVATCGNSQCTWFNRTVKVGDEPPIDPRFEIKRAAKTITITVKVELC